MTGEQVALLAAAAKILEFISSLPVASTITVAIIGPWVMSLIFAWVQEKRFRSMKAMYENNFELVKEVKAMAEERQELVIMNASSMQELTDSIHSNLFCPIVRKNTQQTEAST